MIHEEIKNKILSALAGYFGDNLEAVVLYGSHAEDRATRYSDIDILIILRDGFSDWRAKRQAEVAVRKETLSLGAVSPKIMSVKELASALEGYNPLALNALASGVVPFDNGCIEKSRRLFSETSAGKLSRLSEGYWRVAV